MRHPVPAPGFAFKDPDRHPLEILEFPPDKGDPKWRRPSRDVFLGIDHTAIVVGDTDASLRFYRDTLGMRVAGQGENWRPEQERLNNVPGGRLRITTLRAATGPGIELLEYLTPRDGRLLPAETRANDLLDWQTLLRVRTLWSVGRRCWTVAPSSCRRVSFQLPTRPLIGIVSVPHEWVWTYVMLIMLPVIFLFTDAGRSFGLDSFLAPRLDDAAADGHRLARVVRWLV